MDTNPVEPDIANLSATEIAQRLHDETCCSGTCDRPLNADWLHFGERVKDGTCAYDAALRALARGVR